MVVVLVVGGGDFSATGLARPVCIEVAQNPVLQELRRHVRSTGWQDCFRVGHQLPRNPLGACDRPGARKAGPRRGNLLSWTQSKVHSCPLCLGTVRVGAEPADTAAGKCEKAFSS